MATTYNPELHDALVSAGSGEGPARAAAESVSREIREARDDAVKESGRNAQVAAVGQAAENRKEFAKEDDAAETRSILMRLDKSVAWIKGVLQIMAPMVLAIFAAIVGFVIFLLNWGGPPAG